MRKIFRFLKKILWIIIPVGILMALYHMHYGFYCWVQIKFMGGHLTDPAKPCDKVTNPLITKAK